MPSGVAAPGLGTSVCRPNMRHIRWPGTCVDAELAFAVPNVRFGAFLSALITAGPRGPAYVGPPSITHKMNSAIATVKTAITRERTACLMRSGMAFGLY